MVKCEVMKDCVIAIQKGSIVYVSERQFELSRRNLKPILEEKADVLTEVKATEEKPKKARKKKTEEE